METQKKIPAYYLAKILPWIETTALILLMVTAAMMILKIPADELFMVAMATLAITFFVNVKLPPAIETKGDTLFGFKEMMAYLILPKVMWMSASISTIGILFHFLGFTGAINMLMVGGTSLLFSLVILAVLFLSDTKGLKIYQAILIRVLPVLAVALYLLLGVVG